jgi:hypothetical protein
MLKGHLVKMDQTFVDVSKLRELQRNTKSRYEKEVLYTPRFPKLTRALFKQM